jgi:hypothetical protein
MKKLIAVLVATVGIALPGSADAHFYAHCKSWHCKRHVVRPFKSRLIRMARCESGMRWWLHNSYEGGLQFGSGTWDRTGSRYAAAYQAPPLEQEYRAVIWASMIGWRWHSTMGWPVCG